jgi:glycosyltransferase involved in cell wall biosynthesis
MAGSQGVIHLINPLWNAAGGSEARTLELYGELQTRARVTLWSEFEPDARLAARYPIRRIRARRFRFPLGGTFVFVGVYRHAGKWVHLAVPRRVIVVYNTPDPDLFDRQLRRLSRFGTRAVEVVYASRWLQRSAGRPGVLHPSLIDLDRFRPAERRGQGDGRPFVVGRLSRDIPEKHHPADPALYRCLAEAGVRVRVMGGGSLEPVIGQVDGIELLPECSQDPVAFLQTLDCFVYRTADHLTEAFGRVVIEAMACGLPVVCHQHGGYTEVIESGRNGFLFGTDAEALALIRRLRSDHRLRESIGCAARETVLQLLSPERRQAMADFYLE